tara:strand:+ start:147526 stop:147648 length:123 start_codon:yes stop_codon:yes gene_type:complete
MVNEIKNKKTIESKVRIFAFVYVKLIFFSVINHKLTFDKE